MHAYNHNIQSNHIICDAESEDNANGYHYDQNNEKEYDNWKRRTIRGDNSVINIIHERICLCYSTIELTKMFTNINDYQRHEWNKFIINTFNKCVNLTQKYQILEKNINDIKYKYDYYNYSNVNNDNNTITYLINNDNQNYSANTHRPVCNNDAQNQQKELSALIHDSKHTRIELLLEKQKLMFFEINLYTIIIDSFDINNYSFTVKDLDEVIISDIKQIIRSFQDLQYTAKQSIEQKVEYLNDMTLAVMESINEIDHDVIIPLHHELQKIIKLLEVNEI